MNKNFGLGVVCVLIVAGVIGSVLYVRQGNERREPPSSAVEIVGDRQIVTVLAKGGYTPRVITARADMPLTLRMQTRGTFDCSSSFTIPSLGINKFLPSTGMTEFDIPSQAKGSKLTGVCSMGMYSFAINFE